MVSEILEGHTKDMRQEKTGKSGGVYGMDMPVNEIKIYQCFAEHPPGPEKME